MAAESIFNIHSSEAFNAAALETFRYQFEAVPIYNKFCNALNRTPSTVKVVEDIPFLPIEMFKEHRVMDASKTVQTVFTSSGTTGPNTSKHYVANLQLYKSSFVHGFEHFFGPAEDMIILALLPSYHEQENSSLLFMVNELISRNKEGEGGFYLDELDELIAKIEQLESAGKKALLLGVSYALLDLIALEKLQLKHTMVMETGGMKGRRRELIRHELHERLKEGLGVSKVYSEYGMTELLSQAYSMGEGLFSSPPWMQVYTRNTENPLEYVMNTTGGLNIIDLANRDSCSFIATQDLGKKYDDGSFEILGRFDHSDVRGCNLMIL